MGEVGWGRKDCGYPDAGRGNLRGLLAAAPEC